MLPTSGRPHSLLSNANTIAKRLIFAMDFGVRNFRYVLLYTVVLMIISVSLSPYTISVDGFGYLTSAEVLFTTDFSNFYHWIREPGYPLFVRMTIDLLGLLFTFYVQGLLIAFGVLTTILGTYKILKISEVTWKTYLAASVSLALLAGYATALLQQSLFVAFFGSLILIIGRILDKRRLDAVSIVSVFLLILISTSTAVFIGMAISLALFVTLIASGIMNARIFIATLLLTAVSFSSVMIPWSQIKSSYAPPGSQESLAIGAQAAESFLGNFNLTNEGNQFVLVLGALLNLGGELAPTSGLGIANENSIFGAPTYSSDHACGRFLHAGPADALWGKALTTNYQDRCVPQSTLSVISKLNVISQVLFPAVGLAILFSLLLSLRLVPKLRSLAVPAILVISPYLLLDLSISRYGALIIPLGGVLLVEFIFGKSIGFSSQGDSAYIESKNTSRVLINKPNKKS
jgi:hypothetical protein